MKHKSLIIIVPFLLLATIVTAQYWEDYYDESGEASHSQYTDEDPRFPDWYDVSDGELTFCSQYGGYTEDQSYYQSTQQGTEQVIGLTMTAQGYRTTQYESYLYEVAWYVHPFNEDLTYTISVVDESDNDEELFTGFAPSIDGDAGYEAFESTTDYEYVRVEIEGKTETLEVPFVEK